MNISIDNLGKVQRAFKEQLEKSNLLIDLDTPFFNAYSWEGKKGAEEILFSVGYKTQRFAEEMADQSHFNPTIANAKENDVKWIGVLDGSKAFIRK